MMRRTHIACLLLLLLPGLVKPEYDTLRLPFRLLTIEDGLSQGMVNAIIQDRFGFLWFATKDGLDRYDGYSFEVYRSNAADTTSIRDNYIGALHEGPDGEIWIGTGSRGVDVFDRRTEQFRQVDLGAEGNASFVLTILHDDHGNIWIATDRGLFKVERTTGGSDPPIVRRYFDAQCRVAKDHRGVLWCYLFATGSFRIHPSPRGPDRVEPLDMAPLKDGPWNADANTNVNGHFLVHPSDGRVFAVHPYFIAEYDPVALVPRIIHRVEYPGGSRLEFDQASIDSSGVIWMASVDLWRFDTRTHRMTKVLARDPGMSSALLDVSTTCLDRNGLLWVGTKGYGVLSYDTRVEQLRARLEGSVYWMQSTDQDRMICLKPRTFLRVYDPGTDRYVIDLRDDDPRLRSQFDGLMPDTHAAIMDKDGTFWMSKGALIHFDPVSNKVTHFPLQDDQGRPLVRRKGFFPLIPEGDHLLWFGTDSAFCMFDKRTGHYTHHRYPVEPKHMPYMFAQAAHLDRDRVLWIGTVKGLLRLAPSTGEWKHHRHDPADTTSLSSDIIFSILPDPTEPDRYLWIGTNGGGLNRFDKQTGHCDRHGIRNGLPNDVIYGIQADGKGRLWMSTNKGLCRFNPLTGGVRNYDARDGLQGDEFNRNAFCKLDDGTMFFGGVQGFNQFHPDDLENTDLRTEVIITDIKVLNHSLSFGRPDDRLTAPAFMSSRIELPYSASMITFQFANMDLAHPERNEFRYHLEGFDLEPIEARNSNSAIYTNLDPGSYTFRVWTRARNGEWSNDAATMELVVIPPWWRTNWFYALIGFLLLGGVVMYAQVQRWQRAKLERTVQDRTRDLSREMERSDGLLRNILPSSVADELRSFGRAEARQFDRVTILFSDFKEFTGISERLSPAELVEELHVCFMAFDRIMEKYGIEKIKTIGDAYMAAGGVPDPRHGSPLEVVLAGLEMQRIMAERKLEREAQGRPTFEMRVGINTGPVVAGIVGLRKFQYDIWGDAVNVASRMESSCEVGRVNISGTTYQLIMADPGSPAHRLSFTPRGRVQVKGKGEIDMYYVGREEQDSDESPALVQAAPTMHPFGAPAPSTPSGEKPLKGLRILLVEDNDFNVMVAQDELRDSIPGVHVEVAVNGRIAVDKMRQGRYDLVLMDVQMPEMDGYEATRIIRTLSGPMSRIPIVAMTANVMRAEVDRCMEAGMNAFVPKPFRREELLAALRSVLNANTDRT